MKLIEFEVETLTDRHHHFGEQRGSISIKQPVQSASEPVVAEVLHLLGGDAEHPAGEGLHCLLLAVNRLSLDDDRAQHHSQCPGMGNRAPGVGRDVSIEHILQTDALNKMIDEG